MTTPQSGPVDHPSPHRAETGLAALLYGLVAGPAAWVVEQLVNATLAQEACFPGTERLATPTIANLHILHAAVLVVAILVSASGAIIALGAWRATKGEQAGGSHTLLSIGEGRSRFMALSGLLTSLGFIVGALFSVPALIFVPAC
jgi:hypothetical protein